MAAARRPEAIRVTPVGHPPTSHHLSSTGHPEGAGGRTIQRIPTPISQSTPTSESAIRGLVLTLSAAPRRAARLTGSTRRSAHSYCVASSATPANSASSPGPGSTSAAMPTTTMSQPSTSRPTRLAARFTTSAYEPDPGRSPVDSLLVVAEGLVVGAGPRCPRQLPGRAYDDQLVAPRQERHRRVEVAVDLLIADHGDDLVGQRLRSLADLADQQVTLGDLQTLAVGEQVLHHRAEVGREGRET